MLRLNLIAVALSTLSFAGAQTQNFTIDINGLDAGTKATWCNAELNTCQTLCGNNNIGTNECQTQTLVTNCTCADSTVPPLYEYTNSMPYFICEQAYKDCMAASPNDAKAQAVCQKTIQDQCGSKTPAVIETTPTTSAAVASSTGSAESSSSPSASATVASSSSSTAAAAATKVAYLGNGAAVVAAGLFAVLL